MITDYKLRYKENFKILHFTDTQLIDSSQQRRPDRLCQKEYDKWLPEHFDVQVFDMMDDLVERTNPDLILIEGDIVYGEFDDAGTSLKALIDKLDSYKIPFSVVFGNHDNECLLGRGYQREVILSSKYAMYKDDLCSIGLYDENDNLVRVIVMMDTNGCWYMSENSIKDGAHKYPGLCDEQIANLIKLRENVDKEFGKDIKFSVCQHIIPSECREFFVNNNYITIPLTEPYIANKEGEFGALYERPCCYETKSHDLYKQCGVDEVYVGHDHIDNLSFVMNDIRYTYVTKTGRYDYHRDDMLGGTVTILSEHAKSVKNEHIYSKK